MELFGGAWASLGVPLGSLGVPFRSLLGPLGILVAFLLMRKSIALFVYVGALFGAKMAPKSIKKVTNIDHEIYTDFDTVFCVIFIGFGAAQTPKTFVLLK
jgi:hypothetical protein